MKNLYKSQKTESISVHDKHGRPITNKKNDLNMWKITNKSFANKYQMLESPYL